MDNVTVNLEVFEILQAAQRSRSNEKRVMILKEHDCLGLRDILKAAYDERLLPVIPTEEPPYTPNSQESYPTNLHKQSAQLAYFFKGVPGLPKGKDITKLRREKMFIQFIEGLPPQEAALVISSLNKKLPPDYSNITEEIVRAVWPNMLHKKEK